MRRKCYDYALPFLLSLSFFPELNKQTNKQKKKDTCSSFSSSHTLVSTFVAIYMWTARHSMTHQLRHSEQFNRHPKKKKKRERIQQLSANNFFFFLYIKKEKKKRRGESLCLYYYYHYPNLFVFFFLAVDAGYPLSSSISRSSVLISFFFITLQNKDACIHIHTNQCIHKQEKGLSFLHYICPSRQLAPSTLFFFSFCVPSRGAPAFVPAPVFARKSLKKAAYRVKLVTPFFSFFFFCVYTHAHFGVLAVTGSHNSPFFFFYGCSSESLLFLNPFDKHRRPHTQTHTRVHHVYPHAR